MTGDDDIRKTVLAIIDDAQTWDDGVEKYAARIMAACAAERDRQSAEIAELRAEVERLRALTTWVPISEAPHAVRLVPIDLYHELFGRIPDCYWHQGHGWVRITRGDRGWAPIEHPGRITHYTLKPAPPVSTEHADG